MSLDMRFVLESLLPPGPIWVPAPDGDFDDLLQGMGDNHQAQYERLFALQYIREPLKTEYLDDLEREYGVIKDTNLTEDVRRQQLHARKYADPGFGLDYMQDRLQEAGFDLVVQANDPAVDPALLIGNQYWVPAGGDIAYAGYHTAGGGLPILSIAGWEVGGEWVINGAIFDVFTEGPFKNQTQKPEYLCIAGYGEMVAESRYAYAGYFLNMISNIVEYPIPTCVGRWPLIFFIAQSFSGWDEIPPNPQAVPGEVPNERKEELKRIILRHKPLHSWCGLIVNYT